MFTQRFLAALVATASVFVCGSHALVARSPSSAASVAPVKVSHTTYTPLASDFPDVSRDWPSGGTFGGRTLMVWSDTEIVRDNKIVDFTSNSYAYLSNPNEPTEIQDIGSNETPTKAIPWGWGECSADVTEPECSPWNATAPRDWWIWPESALVTQYNDPSATEAYAISNVGIRVNNTTPWEYNTLVHWTTTDTGVNATRPVEKYITSDSEYRWGWSLASHTDGKVRMFATKESSLYIAEAAWDTITDNSTFLYWDGKNYQDDESSAAVIATGDLSSGNVWYCEVCNTWILAYMGPAGIGSPWYVRYSLSGKAHGPYSEQSSAVFDPPWGTDYNYGGQAYPQFFGTNGQEVLLSWTYRANTPNLANAMLTQMAKLTFSV